MLSDASRVVIVRSYHSLSPNFAQAQLAQIFRIYII